MPRENLTDAFVKSAKPIAGKLTEYIDKKERGLCLRVTPGGVKSWTYRYRVDGKQKRLPLGRVDDVDLFEARKLVVDHRSKIGEGADPVAEARIKKRPTSLQRRETVKQVGEWYFQRCFAGNHKANIKRPKRASTINGEKFYFENHIAPTLGDIKLTKLKRADIQSFIDDLPSKSCQRQCRVVLLAIYSFAQWQEITELNPVKLVSSPVHQARERVLSNSELKTVWETITPPLERGTMSPATAIALKLLIVTLQRRAEIAGAKISEFDFEKRLWIIPGDRTKNHYTHFFPLSDFAISLIQEAISVRMHDSPFLFPSPREAEKPITAPAITKAFNRVKPQMAIDDIRVHDLRRTGSTNLTGEDLGFPRFIVSKFLNHTSDTGGAAAVTGTYDRNDYLSEKRRAAEAWSLRLLEIVEDQSRGDNVVSINQ